MRVRTLRQCIGTGSLGSVMVLGMLALSACSDPAQEPANPTDISEDTPEDVNPNFGDAAKDATDATGDQGGDTDAAVTDVPDSTDAAEVTADIAETTDTTDTPDTTETVTGTCQDRCGEYDAKATCQCDEYCSGSGDCCSDFETLCGTDKACAVDADCDDLDPCTTDACLASQCTHSGNGSCCTSDAGCDDQNLCTTDKCTGSGCTNDAKACDDGLACTNDSCDAKTGQCVFAPLPGACAIDGFCRTNGEVSTANACQSCNATKNQTGWTVLLAAPCDDGSACTGKDACDAAGKCVGIPKPECCKIDSDCVNDDVCMTGSCDAQFGTCSFEAKANCCTSGVCCDPVTHTVKTAGATCGAAALATDYACTDNVAQSREAYAGCDGKNAAICPTDKALYAWTPWKALQACTAEQKCVLKTGAPPVCEGLAPVADCTKAADCDDKNPCTDDSCVVATQKCSNLPKKCPDGDTCESGTCDAVTGACKLVVKAGSCRIDNQCVVEGVKKADDTCLACQPAKGTTAWTLTSSCSCASGVCCNVPQGRIQPKGFKCGPDIKATQYACSTDGKSVETRTAYQGCTGGSNTCSVSASNYAWEAWKTFKACSAGETCEVTAVDVPGTCKAGADPLCGQKDDYEAGTTAKTAVSVGAYTDASALKTLAPQVLLGASTDADFVKWTVDDGVNSFAPVVSAKWTAADKVTVCLWYACQNGANATDCAPVTCPAGSTTKANADVSGVAANGCCATAAATGSLAWTPKPSSGTNASGIAWLSVTNASAKCQQVAVDLEFGAKTATVCTPGTTCCEADGTYSAKAKQCSNTVVAAQYKCESADQGGNVLSRKAYQGCTGTGTTCSVSSTNYAWTDWSVFKDCGLTEICQVPDINTPGTCKSTTVCTPGTTCCAADGTWAAKGAVCGAVVHKVEYQCSGAGLGATAQVRKQYDGCTGASGTCSVQAINYGFTDWSTYQACGANEYCLAGATVTTPPTCSANSADLCAKSDKYEGTESTAASYDLGTWKDTDKAVYMDPKVHLKSATDKDYFVYGIEDAIGLTDPRVNITWTAAKSVTVCAYFECIAGPNGTDCDPITCPAGSVAMTNSAVSGVVPNGCCKTGVTGQLLFDVNAPGTTDETGLVWFNVKNEATSPCQEVSIKLAFQNSADSVCDPATTCCSATGGWAASGATCGAATKTEYKCSKSGAGGIVQSRSGFGSCSGSSASCSTSTTAWGAWTTYLACTSSEFCSVVASATPGTCQKVAAGSCAAACGGQSKDGTCYCDALCTSSGDCCGDFEAKCGGTCDGACGLQSKTGPCYCDAFCSTAGDCCLDKAAKCGN